MCFNKNNKNNIMFYKNNKKARREFKSYGRKQKNRQK